jgi:hypothetical protein
MVPRSTLEGGEGNVEVEKLGIADVELVTGRHSRRDSTFKRSSCRMKPVIA